MTRAAAARLRASLKGRAPGALTLGVCACVALALALRLLFRIDYAEEVDSIRFILALDRFDMMAYQPHFPGYLVFVVLGKAANLLLGDPVAALALVCALSGAALVAPVALLVRELFGNRAAWVVLPLVAVNPLLWLYSEKLLSDMPGLLFLFSSLALLARGLREDDEGGGRWLLAAGLALGLTLGVRLSYFPFALSMLVAVAWLRRRSLLGVSAAFTAGCLAWGVPLLVVSGLADAATIGQIQALGHFGRFGGSVATEPDLWHRLTMLSWEVVAQGLCTWWSDRSWLLALPTAGLALALLPGLRRRALASLGARPALLWALLTVPYLVWIFLAQNITVKPRHSLPVVVLMLVLCAAVTAAGRGANRLVINAVGLAGLGLWLGGQAVTGYQLARQHQVVPSNAVRMAREVARHCNAARPVVYTATFQRHLQRHAACAEVVVARRISHVKRDLSRRPEQTLAFVVSDVGRARRLRRVTVRRFVRDRYIQNARHTVALYRLGGPHAP